MPAHSAVQLSSVLVFFALAIHVVASNFHGWTRTRYSASKSYRFSLSSTMSTSSFSPKLFLSVSSVLSLVNMSGV